jgi:hypothetical protein
MARIVSRKRCLKRTARMLHKKATTKRQHQKVVGKASKACSRKMRMRKTRKPIARKTSVRRQGRRAVVTPPQGPVSQAPPAIMPPQGPVDEVDSLNQLSVPGPFKIPGMSVQIPQRQGALYSYDWFMTQFSEAARRVAGVKDECQADALARELRLQSRNLMRENNGDRVVYESDPRRTNMIDAFDAVLERCGEGPGVPVGAMNARNEV